MIYSHNKLEGSMMNLTSLRPNWTFENFNTLCNHLESQSKQSHRQVFLDLPNNANV